MIKANAGNLSPELMRHYGLLADARVSDNDSGNYNRVIFRGDHVIKYPRRFHLLNENSQLEREYHIGLDLAGSFIVPQMHAMGVTDNYLPFIVMKKMDLFPETRHLYPDIFQERRKEICKLGYEPTDMTSNFSWSDKHQDICLYDFEFWTGPRVEELMREASQ